MTITKRKAARRRRRSRSAGRLFISSMGRVLDVGATTHHPKCVYSVHLPGTAMEALSNDFLVVSDDFRRAEIATIRKHPKHDQLVLIMESHEPSKPDPQLPEEKLHVRVRSRKTATS